MAKLKLINYKNRHGCEELDKSGSHHIVANISEVSKYILNNKYSFLVVISCFIVIPVFSNNPQSYVDQQNVPNNRESRKLFGGYRIVPHHCKATRASRYNHGPTICMFNFECERRDGEVVGACMDGFLFGACCQLKESSGLTIPNGPGVVVTDDLNKYDEEIDVSDQSASFEDHFNFADPNIKSTTVKNAFATKIVEDTASTKLSTEIRTTDIDLTNGYDDYHRVSTEKINSDILTDGVNQITDSLLHDPPQVNSDQVYNLSTLSQNTNTFAETILYHTNGTEVNDVVRPSDFEPLSGEVQISLMQTKPTMPSNALTSKMTTTPATLYTHKPIYQKPIFKPKPIKNYVNADKFVLVQTLSKPGTESPNLSSGSDYVPSIDSIIQMLNESSPTKFAATTGVTPEHKDVSLSSPVTVPSISYTSGYTSSYLTQTHHSTGGHFTSTLKPPSTSYVYGSAISKRPIFMENVTKKPAEYHTGKPGATTVNNQYFSSTNSFSDENKLTTLSYVTLSQSTTTRKPPSTSYIYNPVSPIRPESNLPTIIHKPSFDFPVSEDNFASVTPTVIVLGNLSPPKPKPSFQRINDTIKDQQLTDNFIQISQEPYKKPVSQVTINNVISSTHNIHLNSNYKPVADVKPSPTVVITPKPSSTTSIDKITKKPIKNGNTTPSSANTPSSMLLIQTTNKLPQVTNQLLTSGTLLITSAKNPTQNPTTYRPELQTSPDDLINFPPVRNPNLNATGSNPAMFFNGTAALSDDIAVLQDVEFTTPSFLQEDAVLNEKMNVFVSKIVGSLQGTFQELHDIVILNKLSNSSTTQQKPTTAKPVRKPSVPTKKPATTTRKPVRATTTTKRPTKKPTRVTVGTRKPTTTVITTTTKRPRVTTKKPTKPTKRVTTTTVAPITTTSQYLADDITTEGDTDEITVDYNDQRLCGVRPLVKSGRIVGGKGASYGEWPWQVLVRESTWLGLFTKNKCGGVLITSRYVTTAAHCQPGFLASLVAVFGEHDISGDLESRRPVSKNVRRVIVHRQYDAATFENDLALLELESPVAFDVHIVPICMPPDEADFTGRMATVTGWGRLKYGGGVPAVLQEVQVPVIENSVCQEMFQTAGHSKVILSSFMCAGYANGQKDSCEGDSGGPLVLQRPDGRWQLVGTVSHGIKCAAPYLPGVYMRTTFYKPWLKSITGVQ